ncbi:hypothetical protein ACFQ69_11665 [Streptomyces sp. NPDC056470]|uniref:hypothetical protein n=1 Tax=Streptomyces sp. NPDC056470 TaxID=3345831 RepID=UPI0036BB781B
MSPRPNPHLKSITPTNERAAAAEQPRHLRAVGASKVVAEGVPIGSDPHSADGPRIVGMLHVCLPNSRATPTATSRCDCGRNRSAVGQRQVLALVNDHIAHRAVCPLLNPTEGRTAA